MIFIQRFTHFIIRILQYSLDFSDFNLTFFNSNKKLWLSQQYDNPETFMNTTGMFESKTECAVKTRSI